MSQRLAVAIVALSDCFAKCIEAVRVEEREECARIAEHAADWSEDADFLTGYAIATRIRARKPAS